MQQKYSLKRTVSFESLVFIVLFLGVFMFIGSKMGAVNMISTMMNTAYDLLISTVFYIMAMAVLAGAISDMLSEFGIIAIANKLLSPLVKPLYGLPGSSIIGIFSTYLSDNPAILMLAKERSFKRYFKKYQLPALTNLGTAFGMGLIVSTFMVGLHSPVGESFISAVVIGNVAAILGSIVSVRVMLYFTSRAFGKDDMALEADDEGDEIDIINFRTVRDGSFGGRLMASILDGGKSGVNMGLDIIPGVLIICTFIMMLTNGASPSGEYTGAAYEGIALFPYVADKFNFVIKFIFNFSSPEAIAVPITSLGSAGAAISIVPSLVSEGKAGAPDIAVFTAMCMCWSGYLSTHVAMMEALNFRFLTSKAILSHTLGGLVAGMAANVIFRIYSMI